jgi:hypothetical protein
MADRPRSLGEIAIKAMKFSMLRAVVAGSFEDRDLHAGQQHVPLARILIPGRPERQLL